MGNTVINIKTDPEIKAKAQEIASEMGVSLILVLNEALKSFINQRKLVIGYSLPSLVHQRPENIVKES